ncbi:MAG: shikimate kinase [Bacteroidetes bacterium]|nr:MAG: shikimate kinase [Bacteroidota bacterium]
MQQAEHTERPGSAMLVFLIGFMGAGKTTLGKAVAPLASFDFLDLDDRIVEMAGASIPEIFAREGEQGFRLRERAALESLSALKRPCLVACGGGTPCFHDNMQWMNAHGHTIYLRPDIAILAGRLRLQQAQRPLIREVPPHELEAFITRLLAHREPYYLQAYMVLEGNVQARDLLKVLNSLSSQQPY